MAKFDIELWGWDVSDNEETSNSEESQQNRPEESEETGSDSINTLEWRQEAVFGMLPDKYLKENDIPFFDGIKDKLDESNNWDEKKLFDEIKGVKIESDPITKDDWDKFIEDLRSEVKEEHLDDFNSYVKEFKESKIYKSSELDIKSIWTELDEQTDRINKSDNDFRVEVKWQSYEFNSKKEALNFIYKMKLIFKEISYSKFTILSFSIWKYKLFDWFDVWNIFENLAWGVWNLLYYGWIIGWFAFVGAGPVLAWLRNTQDFIVKNLWDTWWKFLNNSSKTMSIPDEFFKKWWKYTFLFRAFTYPISLLWKWLSTNSNIYIPLSSTWQSIKIIDWISWSMENSDAFQSQRRMLALDYYKKKWKNDPIRLEEFEKLEKAKYFIVWWQMISGTNTFWKNLKKIDNWEIIFRSDFIEEYSWRKWIWKLWKNAVIQWFKTWSFNDETDVISDINKWVEIQRKALGELFDVKDLGWWKIEKWDPKDILKHIEWYIDYESSIDPIYEKSRRERITKYIKGVENMDIFWVTPESIKQDLMLISDWFLTKYESMDLLLKKLKETDNPSNKKVLKDIIEIVNKWELTFKNEKGELDSLLSKSNLTESDFTELSKSFLDEKEIKEWIESKSYNNVEIEAREFEWRELIKQKFDLSELNKKEAFINYFEKEKQVGKLLNSSFDNTHFETELWRLFNDIKEINGVSEVCYLNKEINYIVDKIIYSTTSEPFSYESLKKGIHKEKIDKDIFDKDTLLTQKSHNLVNQINDEITKIEGIEDVDEKEEKFEKLKKKYNITFEKWEIKLWGKWELWDIIWNSSNEIKTTITKINEEIKKANSNFIEVDKEGELKWKSKWLIVAAEKWGNKTSEFFKLEEIIVSYYENKWSLETEFKKIEYKKLEIIVDLIKKWGLNIDQIEKINFTKSIQYFEKIKEIVDFIIKKELNIDQIEKIDFTQSMEDLEKMKSDLETQNPTDNSGKKEKPETKPKDSSKTEWSKTEWNWEKKADKLNTKKDRKIIKKSVIEKGKIIKWNEQLKLLEREMHRNPKIKMELMELRREIELQDKLISIDELKNKIELIKSEKSKQNKQTSEKKNVDIKQWSEVESWKVKTTTEVTVWWAENFDGILEKWKWYSSLIEKLENLKQKKLRRFDIKNEIWEIKIRETLGYANPIDIEKRNILESELRELETEIKEMKLKEYHKWLTFKELEGLIKRSEVEFRNKLKENKSIKEFISKKWKKIELKDLFKEYEKEIWRWKIRV